MPISEKDFTRVIPGSGALIMLFRFLEKMNIVTKPDYYSIRQLKPFLEKHSGEANEFINAKRQESN